MIQISGSTRHACNRSRFQWQQATMLTLIITNNLTPVQLVTYGPTNIQKNGIKFTPLNESIKLVMPINLHLKQQNEYAVKFAIP